MTKTQKGIGISLGILFFIFNCFDLYRELALIPALVLLVVGICVLCYNLELSMYFLAFVTPLSFELIDKQLQIGISIPAEIIMILIMILFVIRLFFDIKFEKKILLHPVSISVLVYMSWILITSITSELPLVSIKSFISTAWFIIPCFFLVIYLARQDTKKWVTFMNCYMAGLFFVICSTLLKLSLFGLTKLMLHTVMCPFYNDHTAFGAALTFLLLIQSVFLFNKNVSLPKKLLYIAMIIMLSVALYFSFCRAAWLSLALSILVLLALLLKIRLSWIIIGIAFLAFYLYNFSGELLFQLARNKVDSSKDISEHVQSIANIKTDASNVERLNRWVAAFGMIEERPWVGWGPGTYQFIYAAFQKPQYKTIITTSFGTGGNCHSEFIGPTAETGFIGLATVVAIMITTIYSGIISYIYSRRRELKIMSLAATLALISYYVHGLMNNFLDTDNLALPFWASVAIIVVVDVMRKEEANQ